MLGLLPKYLEYRVEGRPDTYPLTDNSAEYGREELKYLLENTKTSIEFFTQKVVPVLDRYQNDKKLLEFFNLDGSEYSEQFRTISDEFTPLMPESSIPNPLNPPSPAHYTPPKTGQAVVPNRRARVAYMINPAPPHRTAGQNWASRNYFTNSLGVGDSPSQPINYRSAKLARAQRGAQELLLSQLRLAPHLPSRAAMSGVDVPNPLAQLSTWFSTPNGRRQRTIDQSLAFLDISAPRKARVARTKPTAPKGLHAVLTSPNKPRLPLRAETTPIKAPWTLLYEEPQLGDNWTTSFLKFRPHLILWELVARYHPKTIGGHNTFQIEWALFYELQRPMLLFLYFITEATLAVFFENDPDLQQYAKEHLLVKQTKPTGDMVVTLHHGGSQVEVLLGTIADKRKKRAREAAVRAALEEFGYCFDTPVRTPRTVLLYRKYNLLSAPSREA